MICSKFVHHIVLCFVLLTVMPVGRRCLRVMTLLPLYRFFLRKRLPRRISTLVSGSGRFRREQLHLLASTHQVEGVHFICAVSSFNIDYYSIILTCQHQIILSFIFSIYCLLLLFITINFVFW